VCSCNAGHVVSTVARRGTHRNYGSLDVPTPPVVIDSRRTIRVVIELDAPDCDWHEIVIPGQGSGDDVDPPVDRLEMLQHDINTAMYALAERYDVDPHEVTMRLGAIKTFTKPQPL
jgi:hypothetical protein